MQALKEKRGDTNKLKTLFSFAQEKAEHDEYAAALQRLEVLEKLLDETAAAANAPNSGSNDFLRLWETAQDAWRTASDTVDGQIGQLQNALRSSGFEELKEVSEFGLNGVTGNFKVPLMAVMRNIDAARGDARQQTLGQALDQLQNVLQQAT